MAKIKNVKIDLTEPLGFEKELEIKVGKQSMKVRLDLRTTAKERDKISL